MKNYKYSCIVQNNDTFICYVNTTEEAEVLLQAFFDDNEIRLNSNESYIRWNIEPVEEIKI